MKKLFTILLIVQICILFLGISKSYAFGSLQVKISDNYVSRSPQYKITFISEESLQNGDKVTITFDDAVYLRTEDLDGKIVLNGTESIDVFRTSINSISFLMPFEYDAGKELLIEIANGVAISPSSSCYVRISLTINGRSYNSNYYKITDITTVKDPLLTIGKSFYKVNFSVGEKGKLSGYKVETIGNVVGWTQYNTPIVTYTTIITKNYIHIKFSSIVSTSLPSTITLHEITVNGVTPSFDPEIVYHFKDTSSEEKEIVVVVPRGIPNYGKVEIVIRGINQTFSIPDSFSGEAYVYVWTSAETTAVKSNVINILGAYVVETNCEISPTEPDGENGFYISNPTVELSGDKGNSIEKVETFISIDGKDFQAYTGPITFDDGIYTLNYYSTGYSGKKLLKEDIKAFTLKVDTTSPVINIISPLVTDNRIYTLKVDISDDNLKEVSVQLGSIIFYPYKHNFEIPTVLFQNETQFEIKAVDFAGHISKYKNVIKLN